MKWLWAVLLVYLAYGCAMIWAHPSFIYPFGPDRFGAAGWQVQNIDGLSLARHEGSGDIAVLYFMGNGGSLAYFTPSLQAHVDAGHTVVALQYPGGGGISGEPSERILKSQALQAYDLLAASHEGGIVVHGYSLGTGLALHVAALRDVRGVVLDAPYASMCRLMAQASYLPACFLPFVQKWQSEALAFAIGAPVLIQHGTADQLIPIEEGQRLADALMAAEIEVRFEAVSGATHVNLTRQPGYARRMVGFLAGL